jgi:prephenate dehydrogenase|tara:strand:+ start:858 stop:1865 length:1008 start_codon:yes stop_codon:yes gene_type:complete
LERITIIGIGPIGASIGLALMRRKLNNTEIVVSTGDRKAMDTISKIGAANRTDGNLRSAVSGAQLVVLDAPIGELHELLEAIGPILDTGAVVTDTGPTKTPMLRWAEQYVRDGAAYVGGRPLVKRAPNTIENADATIFQGANYTVTPAKTADATSIRTVVGMVEALGSKPLFLDPAEHDSYAAAMQYLPMVISSAFTTTTAGSDGWREMHLLADDGFDRFSQLAANDPMDNEAYSLASPETLVHWLDQMILELYSYRNDIADKNPELLEKFVAAWEMRARWEADAVLPREGRDLPSARDSMATAFFGQKLADRLSSATKEKGPDLKYTRRSRPPE